MQCAPCRLVEVWALWSLNATAPDSARLSLNWTGAILGLSVSPNTTKPRPIPVREHSCSRERMPVDRLDLGSGHCRNGTDSRQPDHRHRPHRRTGCGHASGLGRDPHREVPARLAGKCARSSSRACQHGTFVAGMLASRHGSAAPGICPDCTLLLRPIFAETATLSSDATVPRAQV